MSLWSKFKEEVVSPVKEAVKEVAGGAIQMGDGIVRVGGDAIAGKSLDKSLERLGSGGTQFLGGSLNLLTSGQGDKIDKFSGGSFSKIMSATQMPGNLVSGKSVSQNIKDGASVALQAGQTYVGAKGFSIGDFDLSNFANEIMGGVDRKLNENKIQPYNPVSPVNYYVPDSSGSYNGETSKSNLPLIAIMGVGAIILIMVLKRKK